MDALGTVRDCGAEDEDYLFSYLFCQVYERKRECRLFSQLHFTLLFDVETDAQYLDKCRRYFEGLYDKIVEYQEEEALKLLEETTYFGF